MGQWPTEFVWSSHSGPHLHGTAADKAGLGIGAVACKKMGVGKQPEEEQQQQPREVTMSRRAAAQGLSHESAFGITHVKTRIHQSHLAQRRTRPRQSGGGFLHVG